MEREATVLVVEDDPDLRELIVRTLRHAGYVVREACDGEQALEACAELPDLILADLMMPQMDGETFLSTLRQRVPDFDVPVVLLSASAARDEVATRLGVRTVLSKPFDVADLQELVAELVRG